MVFSILRALASRRQKSSYDRPRADRRRHRALLRVEELENRLVPAVYMVNTLDDTHDIDLTNMAAVDSNGNTSLRAAIEQANAAVGQRDIEFESGLTGVIELTLGAFQALDKDISIIGPGHTVLAILRPATAAQHRIFSINPGKTCSISGLTIAGGNTTTDGGAIENYGTLYLDNCLLGGNQAPDGSGGAVYNGSGILTVTSCLVLENTAKENGGGFYNAAGTLIFYDTQILGNSAEKGGGIYVTLTSTTTIYSSMIDDNFASEDGGGIYNSGATSLNMIGGRLKENRANKGGGIFNKAGSGSLSDVVIIDNEATNKGGGFYNDVGTLNFNNCFIDGNSALILGPGGAWNSPVNINGGVINDIVQEDD